MLLLPVVCVACRWFMFQLFAIDKSRQTKSWPGLPKDTWEGHVLGANAYLNFEPYSSLDGNAEVGDKSYVIEIRALTASSIVYCLFMFRPSSCLSWLKPPSSWRTHLTSFPIRPHLGVQIWVAMTFANRSLQKSSFRRAELNKEKWVGFVSTRYGSPRASPSTSRLAKPSL